MAWNRSTNSIVAGYNVYYGGARGIYTNEMFAGNATDATISSLIPGAPYYFAVTAYSAAGVESPFSNEVPWAGPNRAILSIQPVSSPGVSIAVRITTAAVISNLWTLQSSPDLKAWTTVASGTNLPVNSSVATGNLPAQFFRLVSQ